MHKIMILLIITILLIAGCIKTVTNPSDLPTVNVETISAKPSAPLQIHNVPTSREIENRVLITEIETTFNQEAYDGIVSAGEKVTAQYKYCGKFISDKYSKIPYVRDQATLYQFDGDVNNCLKEYISNANDFTTRIRETPALITKESQVKIRNQLLQEVIILKKISDAYGSSSSKRHQYIHSQYQTNSLIELSIIIGTFAQHAANEDIQGSFESLGDVYDWWYYNGGVIDTGWGK